MTKKPKKKPGVRSAMGLSWPMDDEQQPRVGVYAVVRGQAYRIVTCDPQGKLPCCPVLHYWLVGERLELADVPDDAEVFDFDTYGGFAKLPGRGDQEPDAEREWPPPPPDGTAASHAPDELQGDGELPRPTWR